MRSGYYGGSLPIALPALILGLSICGCMQSPPVSPPGAFQFFDEKVTGYTTVKQENGGYEFGIATKLASIDAIRKEIDSNADPSWETEGWSPESEQDDLDIITYTQGPSELTITIQAYKEEDDRKWYTVDYTYRP